MFMPLRGDSKKNTLFSDHIEPNLPVRDLWESLLPLHLRVQNPLYSESIPADFKRLRDQVYVHLRSILSAVRKCGRYVFAENPERLGGYKSPLTRKNSKRIAGKKAGDGGDGEDGKDGSDESDGKDDSDGKDGAKGSDENNANGGAQKPADADNSCFYNPNAPPRTNRFSPGTAHGAREFP